MTTDPDAFNSNIAAWKSDEHTPWGRLRRSLALRNLSFHLPNGDLCILDAGGGNGRDSIPLASLGHRVDLVDYSSEMLRDAGEEAESRGIPESVFSRHLAEVSAISRLFPVDTHDVVLLHNVLTYVDDPGAALAAAVPSLRSGGILSLMQVNRYSGPLHVALRDHDLDVALELLDASTSTARIFDNVPARRYSADELIATAKVAGFQLIEHYGILCVCGYILDNDIKSEPEFFAKLERLEIAMATRDPFRRIARFSHMIFAAP